MDQQKGEAESPVYNVVTLRRANLCQQTVAAIAVSRGADRSADTCPARVSDRARRTSRPRSSGWTVGRLAVPQGRKEARMGTVRGQHGRQGVGLQERLDLVVDMHEQGAERTFAVKTRLAPESAVVLGHASIEDFDDLEQGQAVGRSSQRESAGRTTL